MSTQIRRIDYDTRIADARHKLALAMSACTERDVAIWIAALTETLKRVSEWNMDAEVKSANCEDALRSVVDCWNQENYSTEELNKRLTDAHGVLYPPPANHAVCVETQ